MKKIRFLVYTLVFFLLSPLFVYASGGMSVSTSRIGIDVGGSSSFTVSASNAAGRVDISVADSSIASISATSAFLDNNGQSVTVVGRRAGTTTITVRATDMATYDEEVVTSSYTITVVVSTPQTSTPTTPTPPQTNLSSNNNLATLSVTGCTLSPAFNANTTSYTCSEVDGDSVTINATKADSTATLSGTGRKSLNFGGNTFTVTVRAQNGTRKNYTIQVPRKDTRSGDNTLSALGILGQNISFDTNVFEYFLTVSYTYDSITVNATPSDSKASVASGTGLQNLNVGENTIEVVVRAENDTTRNYVLHVTRSEEENIPSTTLVSMVVNGISIDTSVLKNKYLIGVGSASDSVDFSLATSSKTTNFTYTGNENLKEGTNIVKVRITDEDCEDKEIVFIVYKEAENREKITSLQDMKGIEADVLYASDRYKEQIIPEYVFETMKENASSLLYNVVNEQGGLYYSFLFNKDVGLEKDFTIEFIKSNTSPLTYSSNLPVGVKIMVYLEDIYKEEELLYLYSYNQKDNSYTLLDSIRVDNGYVSFVSDGSTQYVLSKEEIVVKKQSTLGEWLIRILFLFLGAGLFVFVLCAYVYMKTGSLESLVTKLRTVGEKEAVKEMPKVEEKVPVEKKIPATVVSPSVLGQSPVQPVVVPQVQPVMPSAPNVNDPPVKPVQQTPVTRPAVIMPAQTKSEPVLTVRTPQVSKPVEAPVIKKEEVKTPVTPVHTTRTIADSMQAEVKPPVINKEVPKQVVPEPIKETEIKKPEIENKPISEIKKEPDIADMIRSIETKKEDIEPKKENISSLKEANISSILHTIDIEDEMDNEPVGTFSNNPGIMEIDDVNNDLEIDASDSMDNELP